MVTVTVTVTVFVEVSAIPCVYVPALVTGVQDPAEIPNVPTAVPPPPPPVPFVLKFILDVNCPSVICLGLLVESSAVPENIPVTLLFPIAVMVTINSPMNWLAS